MVTLDAIEVREREITETVPLVRSEAPAPRKAEEPTRPGRPLPPGARTPKPPFWRRLTAALRSLLSRGELGL
ncbi:MAG TPA: hypothetical protein VGG06_17900 [Thermoanaerobaculia bacterium]